MTLLVLALAAVQDDKVTECANNLSQLWKMACVYMSAFGGKLKKMPSETGGDFWLKLSKTTPPLIDETFFEIYVCPLSKEKPRKDFTTFRGPKEDVNTLDDEAVVGCCEPGLHPDGSINVLRKSGDVMAAKPGTKLYKEALEATAGFAEFANARAAREALRKLVEAQKAFREKDLDGNGVKDYWTGDVSGFIRLKGVSLIDKSLAAADPAPLRDGRLSPLPAEKPVPHHGYQFAALQRYRTATGWKPYSTDTDRSRWEVRHPDRFAFVAYPAEYGKTGRRSFIVDEKGKLWSHDLGGAVLEEFPQDPAKLGWKAEE